MVETRVNLICIASAILGIACIFLSWAQGSLTFTRSLMSSLWHSTDIIPVDFFDNTLDSGLLPLLYAFVLFTIGSIVAVFTPLGGVGQLAGIVLFLLKLNGSIYYIVPMPTIIFPPGTSFLYSSSYSYGLYVAIVAAALSLASVVVSVSVDIPRNIRPKLSLKPTIRERLLTIDRSSEIKPQP